MWIDRVGKNDKFINDLIRLDKQVLIVHGARQVGKTSFILNALKALKEYPQLKLNLLYPSSFHLDGVPYLGRDFFGRAPSGEDFLKNIELEMGSLAHLEKPILVFIDEVDCHPLVLESIQTLAEFSHKLKFVLTGSNLENIPVENAATGRKKYFDLFPITFSEFLQATGKESLIRYFHQCSLENGPASPYHPQLQDLFHSYMRLGGMPRLVATYLDPQADNKAIPEIMKDLAVSIEENVKTILGEKSKLYEYEDILRTMAFLSMNTLKYSHLQVNHAGRSEAKRLVAKTVGARVAHKIRLFELEKDLSKYILFDCGLVNYLLNGSHLLQQRISPKNLAILYETSVGNELIASLISRDDLFYWKSGNRAEVEFILRSPLLVGIDVKSEKGNNQSLNSLALFEPEVSCLVKINQDPPTLNKKYLAKLSNFEKQKTVTLVTIPHYLASRLLELLNDFNWAIKTG